MGVIQALKRFMGRVPVRIQVDNGAEFISKALGNGQHLMLKSVSMMNVEDDLLEAAKKLEGPDSSVFGHAYGFPVKDIVDAMRDVKLQSQHDVEDAIENYGHIIKHLPEDCLWFWFESPGWTWQNLCGSAGWMVISKSDLKFIHFFLEQMN